jgi:hypothetical protein
MGNFLYVLALLLVIAWIIGFYSTGIGNTIHILLVMAVIAVIIRVFNDKALIKKSKIERK